MLAKFIAAVESIEWLRNLLRTVVSDVHPQLRVARNAKHELLLFLLNKKTVARNIYCKHVKMLN